jgi:hypothetical protein
MTAAVAGSPAPVHTAAFRSPLRNLRPDVSDRFASEEIYADAHASLVQWRKGFLSAASFEAQQGLRELSHEKEHLKDLQSDLAEIQGLVQVASHLQRGGSRLTEVLESSRDAAASRAQAVSKMRQEIQACRTRLQEELQEEEQKIVRQREVADAQHGEAIKLLNTYKDRLGLAISRVAPQTVRMGFSLLDESDPCREFSFTVGLAEPDKTRSPKNYSTTDCTPEVPELPLLLEQLNHDASSVAALPRFVCGMRRAFIKSLSKEH